MWFCLLSDGRPEVHEACVAANGLFHGCGRHRGERKNSLRAKQRRRTPPHRNDVQRNVQRNESGTGNSLEASSGMTFLRF